MLFIVLFFIPLFAEAQSISDYLIFNDIGTFKMAQPEKSFITRPPIGGPTVSDGSGVLSGSGHFPDHPDKSYKVLYIDSTDVKLGTEVEVTQHAGGDSDRWLLHEIEDSFRRGNYEEDMTSARFRNIDGNNVFYSGLGGGNYRWLSNFVVIDISYTDLYKQKQEPLEVIKAYLAKFPSTITNMTIDNTHNVQWIKDEIDRRFWLCDKWNAQFQAGQAKQKDLINELVDNMEVFLNYRQAYFGMKAMDEMSALHQLQKNKDIASIQTKLTEYKTWWSANNGKRISL